MRTRTEELVHRLRDGEGEARLEALRAIKNAVIGNYRQKQAFVKAGTPQLITNILSEAAEADVGVLIQAAAAVGSFAATEDGLRAVVDSGAVPQLLRALQSQDSRVVEAAVRSLKAVFKVRPGLNRCGAAHSRSHFHK